MSINYQGSGGGVPRKTAKIFGKNAASADMTVFGSTLGGNTVYSTDLDSIQSAAYETGWRDAVISNLNYPLLSDMNAVQHTLSQQIAYTLQHGIPEYDAGTTYYAYDKVQFNDIIYTALQDNFSNINPSNTSYWAVYYNPAAFANIDLSNLSTTGEAHFANPSLSNLNTAGEAHFIHTNMDNIIDEGEIVVSSLASPSPTYKDLAVYASGATYYAPSNGWLVAEGTITNPTSYIWLHAQVDYQIWGTTINNGLHVSIPIRKGEAFELYYYNVSMTLLRFYYLNGSQHEVNQ